MPVLLIQRNDGVQSGVEVSVVIPVAGWTDQQLMDFKRNEHEAHGWTVSVQQGGRRVVCSKTYPPSEEAKDPNVPTTKERTFRLA